MFPVNAEVMLAACVHGFVLIFAEVLCYDLIWNNCIHVFVIEKWSMVLVVW